MRDGDNIEDEERSRKRKIEEKSHELPKLTKQATKRSGTLAERLSLLLLDEWLIGSEEKPREPRSTIPVRLTNASSSISHSDSPLH